MSMLQIMSHRFLLNFMGNYIVLRHKMTVTLLLKAILHLQCGVVSEYEQIK